MGVRTQGWGGVGGRLGPGVTGSVQTDRPPRSLSVCPSHPAVRLQLFEPQKLWNTKNVQL